MDDPLSKLNLTPSLLQMDKALARAERSEAAGGADRNDTDPRLAAACAEFESLFINHLLKEMRATITKAGLIDGGNAEGIYTAMLDAELARNLAQRGGIGLSALTRWELAADMQPVSGDDSKKK